MKTLPGEKRARPAHTCKDEVALIAAYLAGSLVPPVLQTFEQHLSHCRDCAAFLKTYAKTMELTASLLRMPCVSIGPISSMPPRFSAKVMGLIAVFYSGCIFLLPMTV
jgi:hypothetical protein